MPSIFEIYLQQEFLTPGAIETLDIFEREARIGASSLVLDVATGKGSGALRLAERTGCAVVGVDTHPFLPAIAGVALQRHVADRVRFLHADGRRLPLRDAAFDAASCIGAPSIVGAEACFREMRRTLRPGGIVAVSDWVWMPGEPPEAAIPASFDIAQLTLDEYVAIVREAGFEPRIAEYLPQRVWDAYYAPLRPHIAELRARDPNAPFDIIEVELAAYDAHGADWWRYAVVIAQAIR